MPSNLTRRKYTLVIALTQVGFVLDLLSIFGETFFFTVSSQMLLFSILAYKYKVQSIWFQCNVFTYVLGKKRILWTHLIQ